MFLHQKDSCIERTMMGAELYDSEGDLIYRFPLSWTDDHIYRALAFANVAHEKGVELGHANAQSDMRKCLGLE